MRQYCQNYVSSSSICHAAARNPAIRLMDTHLTSDWYHHKDSVTQGLLALVEADLASWHVNSTGKVEFHLASGEVYWVEGQSVTRTA
jgi:hypothetical protein